MSDEEKTHTGEFVCHATTGVRAWKNGAGSITIVADVPYDPDAEESLITISHSDAHGLIEFFQSVIEDS